MYLILYVDKVYKIYGLKDWGKVLKYCDGNVQFFINIEICLVENDESLKVFWFLVENWYGRVSGVLENNGYVFILVIDKLRGILIFIGGF